MDKQGKFTVEAVCKEALEESLSDIPSDTTDFDAIFAASFDQVIDIQKIQDEIKLKSMTAAERSSLSQSSGRSADTVSGDVSSMQVIHNNLMHANDVWDVIAATNQTGGNKIKRLIRKVLLKVLGWPARKYLRKQIEFNGDLVRIQNENLQLARKLQIQLEAQNEKILSHEAEITAIARKQKSADLEALTVLVRNLQKTTGSLQKQVDCQLNTPDDFDYTGFENLYRGEWKDIQNRMRERYYSLFKDCTNIVDLGCGRGEFLSLLRDNGQNAFGVDMSRRMVEYCTGLGLPVVEGNAVEFVDAGNRMFDGIFCAQVVEHLSSIELMKLVRGCYASMQKGGTIAIETVNPLSLETHRNSFVMDITHRHFVHPYTLKFILESVGFSDVKIEYFTPARELPVMPENTPEDMKKFLSDVQNVLFGAQDYAVTAKR